MAPPYGVSSEDTLAENVNSITINTLRVERLIFINYVCTEIRIVAKSGRLESLRHNKRVSRINHACHTTAK
jgi:hypothetical protein